MTEPVGQSPALTASLELLAAALCHDAQVEGYDHGSNPTLVSFSPAYCPRHLGIAADVRRSLATVRPPGDEAGLRAALAKGLADALTIDWPGDTRLTTAPAIADYLLERPEVRAALAAEPDREEPGLDVERLARAMDVVGRASDRYGLLRREDAAAIATAYGAPAPGLDAALLAAALETTKDLWFGGDRDSWWLAEPEGMAADIAAEYARLANPDREEPADG